MAFPRSLGVKHMNYVIASCCCCWNGYTKAKKDRSETERASGDENRSLVESRDEKSRENFLIGSCICKECQGVLTGAGHSSPESSIPSLVILFDGKYEGQSAA